MNRNSWNHHRHSRSYFLVLMVIICITTSSVSVAMMAKPVPPKLTEYYISRGTLIKIALGLLPTILQQLGSYIPTSYGGGNSKQRGHPPLPQSSGARSSVLSSQAGGQLEPSSGEQSSQHSPAGGPPPPEDNPSLEDALPGDHIFQYFNLHALVETMAGITEMASLLGTVILMLDIDGTVFLNPKHNTMPINFYREQRYVLDIINHWIQTEAKEHVLLVYNTSRNCESTDNPNTDWLAVFKKEHLPMPHIMIHGNGSQLVMANPFPIILEGLNDSENRAQFAHTMLKLKRTLGSHDQIVWDGMYEEDRMPYRRAIEDGTNFGKIARTMSTYCIYSRSGADFDSYKIILTSLARIPNGRKSIFTRQFNDVLLYHDRTINKGSASTLLLSTIEPYLSGKSMLFISGDDSYDLPMLFPDWQSQAFLKPGERSMEQLAEDYVELGLTPDDISKVAAMWQASILPVYITPDLNIVLERAWLIDHPKLMKARSRSLPGILDQVLLLLQHKWKAQSDGIAQITEAASSLTASP